MYRRVERWPENSTFSSHRCCTVDSRGTGYQQTWMGCREISWLPAGHRRGRRQGRFEMFTSNNL